VHIPELALCTAALSWTSASSFVYWTNWSIQVCLTSVVTTTIIRHTWHTKELA